MSNSSNTDVDEFIESLGTGVVKKQLAHLLSKTAKAVYMHGDGKKKGSVTLELKIEQFGDENIVAITHKLSHSAPTKRGKQGEEAASETIMYVGAGGKLSIDQPEEEPNGQRVIQDESLKLVGGG